MTQSRKTVSLWSLLTSPEQHQTLLAMNQYGGGFVSRLAEAWSFADSGNSEKLGLAFDNIVHAYAPEAAVTRNKELAP
jgi:hypothetical protein